MHTILRSLFFKKEMELSLIGLQNAGKTSLVNVLTTGAFHEDMIPTVGFNMRKVTKGAVTIKLWDLGGQASHKSPSWNQLELDDRITGLCVLVTATLQEHVGAIL